MKTLAIDPGANGGFAYQFNDSDEIIALAMPDTQTGVVELLTSIRASGVERCVIEDVGGFVGVGQPGSAMFKFGLGCGLLRGAAMALGFRVELVKPQKWQKHFSLGTVKSSGGKTAWKNKLKDEAGRRFPSCDVTLKTADALLILDYATYENTH